MLSNTKRKMLTPYWNSRCPSILVRPTRTPVFCCGPGATSSPTPGLGSISASKKKMQTNLYQPLNTFTFFSLQRTRDYQTALWNAFFCPEASRGGGTLPYHHCDPPPIPSMPPASMLDVELQSGYGPVGHTHTHTCTYRGYVAGRPVHVWPATLNVKPFGKLLCRLSLSISICIPFYYGLSV